MIPTGLPGASSGVNISWADSGYGFHNDEDGGVSFTSPTEQAIADNSDRIAYILGQTDSPAGALGMLQELAKEDEAYRELYLQLLAERENNEIAWQKYENFNNSYFQRTTKDLEKAGLNPWLALQSLGSSGTGSISSSGTWSGSAYGNKVSKQNAILQNRTTAGKAGLALLGVVVAAIIYALL